ncbi:MAG: hypothetical protein ACK5BG_19410 [Pseudanabaena sp.]
MTDKKEENTVQEEIAYQSMAEFLESTPPNQSVHISDLVDSDYRVMYSSNATIMNKPEIQLHCSHESCNGNRFFRCISTERIYLDTEKYSHFYLTYRCSNCQKNKKIFSLAAKVDADGSSCGECYKYGELPIYGPPVPSRLIKLIGQDREEFLKGRRCENQGLGIGAFVYYRRVVENQKNRIIGEIVKVSERIGAPEDKIKPLRDAIKETQFSKALEMAKDAMPESLLINGHSPILLLHSALSEGVHALTDEQCLELASSIRVVLGELSERLSQALKDELELTRALSTLMHHKKANK